MQGTSSNNMYAVRVHAASVFVPLRSLAECVSKATFRPALQSPFVHFFDTAPVVQPVASSQGSGENMQGHSTKRFNWIKLFHNAI